MKAHTAGEAKKFIDIPNIGPRIAGDLEALGLRSPYDLKGKNAFTLYDDLCRRTKARHDPCVLDTFMAAVDFMNGAAPSPWWHYTKERKKKYPHI